MSTGNQQSNASQQIANAETMVTSLVDSMSGPLRVTSDAGSVEQHPITGMIAAANYLAGLVAAQSKNLGIRYTRLRPGGTVQGSRRDPLWRDGPEW